MINDDFWLKFPQHPNGEPNIEKLMSMSSDLYCLALFDLHTRRPDLLSEVAQKMGEREAAQEQKAQDKKTRSSSQKC